MNRRDDEVHSRTDYRDQFDWEEIIDGHKVSFARSDDLLTVVGVCEECTAVSAKTGTPQGARGLIQRKHREQWTERHEFRHYAHDEDHRQAAVCWCGNVTKYYKRTNSAMKAHKKHREQVLEETK